MSSTSTRRGLKAYLDKLRAKQEAEDNSGIVAEDALVFWGTLADKQYLRLLKSCTGSTTVFLQLRDPKTMMEVEMYCNKKGITRIISTSLVLLKNLLSWEQRAAPSVSNYAGSYFKYKELEIIFIQPLKQLATVPYGKFITSRYVSKFTKPDSWYTPTAFSWEILTPANEEQLYSNFHDAFLISIDIETVKEGTAIRCLSYTAFFFDLAEGKYINSSSVVLPMDSSYNLSIMRKWNELPAPKVMQNGKYDISYFCRYSAPVYNYIYDTAHLFHSWYSELPKDLGFLNAFFIREGKYWKDLADTNDLHEYYRYNALDTWGTGNCFLAMLLEAPSFAIDNYLKEFPLVFPAHLCEMTGIYHDMDKLEEAKQQAEDTITPLQAELNAILGVNFNVASPKQIRQLLDILGCKDIKKGDAKSLKRVRFRHPFNARIINLILEIRKQRKLVSTYLTPGKEFADTSTILYSINPHGTDTSRMASSEHHFWCGINVQNQPRGPIVKNTYKAYPGFKWAEADYAQAESRDTAYISGDLTLIDNVENAPDFHSRNASLFFGIPEDEIKKPIRQISKNVNHGANYNMQEFTLIETMGEENIVKAKQLLELPKMWSFKEVASYLLAGFHKTYPGIADVMYPGIIDDVVKSNMLVSGGWTRYCFGDPVKSRQALNAYIAHKPQCLNAQTLNEAFMNVFVKLSLHPEHSKNFMLITQVHDSIVFQYREGHEYLCDMVKECMEIPVHARSYTGIDYEFIVPVDVNHGTDYWGELK